MYEGLKEIIGELGNENKRVFIKMKKRNGFTKGVVIIESTAGSKREVEFQIFD